MSFISIFDVLGPNMIGPSSSHTAGAAAIALLARKMMNGDLVRADFTLYGSFARTYRGHGTDRALLGGIMGFGADDRRIPDSFSIADAQGLSYSFTVNERETEIHPTTVDIRMEDSGGRVLTVRGESVGGGKVRITRIDQVEVDFSGEYSTLIAVQQDKPGVVAHITRCLSEKNVNIAYMKLYREEKGSTAYSIVESDDFLPEGAVQKIRENPYVRDVMLIQLQSEKNMGLDKTAGRHEKSDRTGSPHMDVKINFRNAAELSALCVKHGLPVSEIMLRRECSSAEVSREDVLARMGRAWEIMKESARTPIHAPKKSMGGLIGGEAQLLSSHRAQGESVCGDVISRSITYAMAVLEVNTSMGLIVAAPTAGSSGVVPGVLLALQEEHGFSDEAVIPALFRAGAVGDLAMRNATVAGGVGGCQAEIGVASAMAASAAVELMGGTPSQCLGAASTVLMNMLGLVCDPIGGLVEAPCQSRNASGAANALIAAELALSGVQQPIPFDEMLEAMYSVGKRLPAELRETARGGCAATPTACSLCGGC